MPLYETVGLGALPYALHNLTNLGSLSGLTSGKGGTESLSLFRQR